MENFRGFHGLASYRKVFQRKFHKARYCMNDTTTKEFQQDIATVKVFHCKQFVLYGIIVHYNQCKL